MKVRGNYIMRKIAGTNVIIPVEDSVADLEGVIAVNNTAAFLFSKLIEEITFDELVDGLINEYDVTKAEASQDVQAFISILKERKMLEE